MGNVVRRDLLKSSLALLAGSGLLTASALKRPALAAGTNLTVWWNQGFYPAEDAAFRSLIATWEKSTGNHIDLTLLPGQALNEKIISALTSGEVPDLMYADNAPAQIVPQNA
jgi:multiple sugar transport system substrate-binding protein